MNKKRLSRRHFLKLTGITSAGFVLSACGVKMTQQPKMTPLSPTSTFLPTSTILPTKTSLPAATVTPTPPTPTLRTIGEKLGIVIGTTFNSSENYQNPELQKKIGAHFDSIMTTGEISDNVVEHPGWAGWKTAQEVREIANQQNMILHLHPGFYPNYMPDRLKSAGKSDIITYMENRISNLLDLVKKVDDGHQPTYLNFINEAIWDGSWENKPDNVGWYNDGNHENPLYRLFGKKWISESYARIYNAAKENGIIIGKDLFMIYNEAHISSPGRKTEFVFDMLSSVKQEVSQALSLKGEQVQLDVGIQLHLSANPELSSPGTYISIPKDEDLLAAMKRFSGIGKIHLTEFDIKDVTQQQRIETLARIFNTAISSGLCKSISLWNTFRFNGDPKSNFDYGPNGLFDTNYVPTDSYNELINSLISIL
jgi:GH35 family endo-1,4-beta-xylanase